MTKVVSTAVVVLIVLIQAVAASAEPSIEAIASPNEVVVPDEEDYLTILDTISNPALLPRLIDLGLINESLEESLPDIIDEWPTVEVGGCLLSTSAPWKSRNGLRVKGEAGYACGEERAQISMTVCLQIREADRWIVMEGSCREAPGAKESTVYKKTSALCRSGTWKYRTIAAGEASGPGQDVAISKSDPSQLDCRTFGL